MDLFLDGGYVGFWGGGSAGLPPAVINVANNEGADATSPFTFSHTTTADTTCLIILATVAQGFNADISAISFNGDPLTEAITASADGTQDSEHIFYLLNPDIGTFTVSIDHSEGAGTNYLIVTRINAKNVTALDVVGSNNAANSTFAMSVPLSLTAPALVVGVTLNGNGGGTARSHTWSSIPASPAPTEQLDVVVNGDNQLRASHGYGNAESAGTYTLIITHSGGSQDEVVVAAAFR